MIKNARLRDRPGLWNVAIEKEKIAGITKDPIQAKEILDAGERLLSPAFIDPHIHLDKVNIVDVVRLNKTGTLKEAIEIIWEKKASYDTQDIVECAGEVIRRALLNGTTRMRTHVDADTIGGLNPLKSV